MEKECNGCFGASFNDCEDCNKFDALYIGYDQTHFIYGHMYKAEVTDEDDYTIVEANGVQYKYESYDGVLRDWKFF